MTGNRYLEVAIDHIAHEPTLPEYTQAKTSGSKGIGHPLIRKWVAAMSQVPVSQIHNIHIPLMQNKYTLIERVLFATHTSEEIGGGASSLLVL